MAPDDTTPGRFLYAHMHLRAERPNHVLIGGDYRRMRDSVLEELSGDSPVPWRPTDSPF